MFARQIQQCHGNVPELEHYQPIGREVPLCHARTGIILELRQSATATKVVAANGTPWHMANNKHGFL